MRVAWTAAALTLAACQPPAPPGVQVAQNAGPDTVWHGAAPNTVWHGKQLVAPPVVAAVMAAPPPPPRVAEAGVLLLDLAKSHRPVRFHAVTLPGTAAGFLASPPAAYRASAARLQSCAQTLGAQPDANQPARRTLYGAGQSFYQVPVQGGTLLFAERNSGADVCELVNDNN